MAPLAMRHVFSHSMRGLIRIRIDGLKDKLAYGAGVPTFDAYREVVGEIRGLEDALEILEDAEKEANERERGL